MVSNPFLDSSFKVRWSLLTPDHVVSGIETALVEAEKAVDAIASQPLESVCYRSTFAALERSTEALNVAWGKVGHLQSVADSTPLRDAYNGMLPKVSAFYAKIPLRADLWQRLKKASELPEIAELQPVERRLVEETLADFRQQGADLDDAKRSRLEALQTELAQLTQKYSENVLDATNAWEHIETSPEKVKDIPAHALESARRSALSKGHGTEASPAWRFTLHMPSLEPVLSYADDEGLRQLVWTASAAVGSAAPHDNTELVSKILILRGEKAALLGKAHFADLVLERRMAKTGARALEFVGDFATLAAGKFATETTELIAYRNRITGRNDDRLAPWEVSYWAEKLRKEKYDFDEEWLRPYFPMDRVIDGLFDLAKKVFGLTITPIDSEAWHPEVKTYEIRDDKGIHVGSFYSDWHPRDSKRGGAWMNYLITGGPDGQGHRLPHLGLICGNMTPPSGQEPALLTHREVQTIFHEFGHLLHHLLGEVPVHSLNGVNVAWDFVELPSQILENWCWEPEALAGFARHFKTGEPIPAEWIEKMLQARRFRAASATMRQVAFAKLDLLLHTDTARFVSGGDVEPEIRKAIASCLIPTTPPAPTILKRFGHLFSDPVGYAAGYYSYKWAEVLDADAFSRFKKEGLFNRSVGAAFVEHILSKGNSEEPAVLYRRFMGRDPELKPLLERSGMI